MGMKKRAAEDIGIGFLKRQRPEYRLRNRAPRHGFNGGSFQNWRRKYGIGRCRINSAARGHEAGGCPTEETRR